MFVVFFLILLRLFLAAILLIFIFRVFFLSITLFFDLCFLVVNGFFILFVVTGSFVCLSSFVAVAYLAHRAGDTFEIAVDFNEDFERALASDSWLSFTILNAARVSIVEWIILVAHGYLNLLKSTEHVVAGQDLLANVVQDC